MSNKQSILMIVLDALRADCAPGVGESAHLRSLGLKPPPMPALASMVSDSGCFTQAMACSAYTTACFGSFLTGLLPPEHGVRAFDLTSLSHDVRTLAEILAAAGYATCAMTDQPPVLQPMGLLRGFQTLVPGEEDALAWWDSYGGAPRFLLLHIWDAHKPYGMPFGRAYRAGYRQISASWQERLRSRGIVETPVTEFLDEQAERQRVYAMQNAWEDKQGFKAGLETYLAGLEVFDHGRLHDLQAALASRGILNEAISVVLADHGEGRDFPPSRRMTHGMSLADDVMHIPLYIRAPSFAARRVIADQVSEADVTPTLLDLVGLLDECSAPRTTYDGVSLAPLLRGAAMPARAASAELSALNNDPAKPVAQSVGERMTTVRFRVLRYNDRKYRLAGRMFDPADEPRETTAEQFVRLICRDLLGRIERPEDFAAWQPLLNNAALPAKERRRAVVAAVESSDEYRFLTKYAEYDLVRDPLEVKPADPRSSEADWAGYQRQVAIMQEIERSARPGEPLLTNEADEQVILKRLQDLGYVE